MGAHTGSACLCVSSAKPIVGVCDDEIPPTILAMQNLHKYARASTHILPQRLTVWLRMIRASHIAVRRVETPLPGLARGRGPVLVARLEQPAYEISQPPIARIPMIFSVPELLQSNSRRFKRESNYPDIGPDA